MSQLVGLQMAPCPPCASLLLQVSTVITGFFVFFGGNVIGHTQLLSTGTICPHSFFVVIVQCPASFFPHMPIVTGQDVTTEKLKALSRLSTAACFSVMLL